jgi:hypothetical protein
VLADSEHLNDASPDRCGKKLERMHHVSGRYSSTAHAVRSYPQASCRQLIEAHRSLRVRCTGERGGVGQHRCLNLPGALWRSRLLSGTCSPSLSPVLSLSK